MAYKPSPMNNDKALYHLNEAIEEANSNLGLHTGGENEEEFRRQMAFWKEALFLAKKSFDRPKAEKYFLCFGFQDQPSLLDFHVTHTYFGELTGSKLLELIKDVDQYMDENNSEEYSHAFREVFDQVEWFGKGKDIRVLTPRTRENQDRYLLKLRDSLTPYIGGEKYDGYNPHLTTPMLKSFGGMISTLHLCSNGYKILKTWEL